MFTYLDPPENIGITCQKEPFNIESLRDTLQGKQDTCPMQEERLERIPSVKKLVGPADVMPREEAEDKVRQYCHLWTMYADSSVELKKKSELSPIRDTNTRPVQPGVHSNTNPIHHVYTTTSDRGQQHEPTVYRDKGTSPKMGGGPVLLLQNYAHPFSLRGRGPYHFPTPLNT